jgi:hypothetical protein
VIWHWPSVAEVGVGRVVVLLCVFWGPWEWGLEKREEKRTRDYSGLCVVT